MIRREENLHQVWQGVLFDYKQLQTTEGKSVFIQEPGSYNTGQGPDFLNARIRIGDELFFGHVEIHLDGNDWYRHGHHEDPNYNPVILHVVAKESRSPVYRQDGTSIPEIRITPFQDALKTGLQPGKKGLPCGSFLKQIEAEFAGVVFREKGKERLKRKGDLLFKEAMVSKTTPAIIAWEKAAGLLGGPVNGVSFTEIVRKLTPKVIMKEARRPMGLVALLAGASGALAFLRDDTSFELLSKEWEFLRLKYGLEPLFEPLHRFGMRPPALPERRLMQLAAFFHHFPFPEQLYSGDFFLEFMQHPIVLPASGGISHRLSRWSRLSKATRQLMLLNVFVPLFMIRESHSTDIETGEIMDFIPAEKNRHCSVFAETGFRPESALESQGMAEIHKEYCKQLRCRECSFGRKFLSMR